MTDHATGAVFPYTHPHPSSAGEMCKMCGDWPASHKVGEDTADERHPFTAYLCCHHFAQVMGPPVTRLCRAAQENRHSRTRRSSV